MADISEIKKLAHTLNLMNIYNGNIDLTDEKISNLDYLYNILKQEVDIRSDNKKRQSKRVRIFQSIRFLILQKSHKE